MPALTFPKPDKTQIFNIEMRNYNQLFKYIHDKGNWNIDDYGDYWYTVPMFWQRFIKDIIDDYEGIDIMIENGGKELVKDFFIDFKKQILYGEAYACCFEFLAGEYIYEEEDSHFLDRYFNNDKEVDLIDLSMRKVLVD